MSISVLFRNPAAGEKHEHSLCVHLTNGSPMFPLLYVHLVSTNSYGLFNHYVHWLVCLTERTVRFYRSSSFLESFLLFILSFYNWSLYIETTLNHNEIRLLQRRRKVGIIVKVSENKYLDVRKVLSFCLWDFFKVKLKNSRGQSWRRYQLLLIQMCCSDCNNKYKLVHCPEEHTGPLWVFMCVCVCVRAEPWLLLLYLWALASRLMNPIGTE